MTLVESKCFSEFEISSISVIDLSYMIFCCQGVCVWLECGSNGA